MINQVDEILKYSDLKYTHIVFRGKEEEYPFDGVHEFWTLEESEEEAKKRVALESDAYSDPDFVFFYKRIVREEKMLWTPYGDRPYIDIKVR